MSINLILPGDDIGGGFNKSNDNFKQQIVSTEVVNGDLRLNKYDGTYFSTPLPIPAYGGQVVTPIGSITLGTQSGTYNQVTISPIDYIYDAFRYNIPTPTIINLTNGDATLDRIDAIIIDVTTNTVLTVPGTPAAPPVLPTLNSNQLLVGAIYVKKGATSILNYYTLVFTAFTSQQQTIAANAQAQFDNLDDLLDVNITAPTTGQVLTYNGSAWINNNSDTITAGNGLTSSFNNFKLGGELSDNVNFILDGNTITFTGYTQSTQIDSNGDIFVGTDFKIYNNDSDFNFNSNGIKVSQGSGSLQIESGLTAGSTQSFTQSFQNKSGVIATLDDIITPPSYAFPTGEIVFGNGTGMTSSDSLYYDFSEHTMKMGPNSLGTASGHSNILSGIFNTFSSSVDRSMIGSSEFSIIDTSARATILSSYQSNISNNSADSAIIGSRISNIKSSCNSNIIGGQCNTFGTVSNGSILGGNGNKLETSNNASILGGQGNTLTNNSLFASIVGGLNNTLTTNSLYSSVVGGAGNTINDGSLFSSVVGGVGNTIVKNAMFSSVITSASSAICCSSNSSIISGQGNTITDNSNRSIILGGNAGNIGTQSSDSSIVGGNGNSVCQSSQSSVIGGYSNKVLSSSTRSSIIGGNNNTITTSSCKSVILGGNGNTISNNSYNSVIISGVGNTMSSGYGSSIIGGQSNCIGFNARNSIIGGYSNLVNSEQGIILGSLRGILGTGSTRSSIISSHDVIIDGNSPNSSILSSIKVNLLNSDNTTVIGVDGGSGGLTFSSRSNDTIVQDLFITGSMSTQDGGSEFFGYTGTHSVGAHTFVIKNGLIISITP